MASSCSLRLLHREPDHVPTGLAHVDLLDDRRELRERGMHGSSSGVVWRVDASVNGEIALTDATEQYVPYRS